MYEDRNNNNDDDENDDVLEFTSPSSLSSVSRSQRSPQQRNNSIDHHDDDQDNDYGSDAAVVVRTISTSSDDNSNNNNNDVEIIDVVSGGGNRGANKELLQQKRNHPPRNRNLDDFLEHAFQATKISSSRCNTDQMPSSSLSFPQVRSSMSYHAINDNDNSNSNSNVNSNVNNDNNNNHTNNELEIGTEINEDNSHSSSNNNNDNSNTIAATIENNNINYNVSSSSSSISLSYLQFKKQWRYWCIMLSLGVANSSDASEILCISYILSDKVFQDNILNDSAFGSGLLTGSVFLGMLLGGLIVGTMGDWIGRKPMLLLGLICNSISGIISSMAWNVYILSFLRMISGIGIGATVPPLFTLATELSPPSIRGFNVTICASFWMVGSIFVAIIALYLFEIIPSNNSNNNNDDDESATTIYGIAIWRIFALICALPSALGAILVYWFVPESPRFLGVEGRSKEAVDVANLLVEKMGHQTNDDDDDDGPLTIEELERTFPPSTIVDTTTVGGAGILGSTLGNGGNVGNSNGGGRIKDCIQFIQLAYIDFCSSTSKLYTTNKQIKQTTLALQMVWFALSFGSYGLLTWINIIFVKVHLENVYYNALLFAFSNLPGNILSGIYMDKIGRSKSLVGSIVLSSISLFFFAIFAEYEYSIGIVLSSCCFQCFTIMAWNTIDTMTSELFPTPCRSTGLGICAASGRIGALIAQFINGYLINSPVKLLLVASGTLLLGAITPYLLPNNGSRDMTGQPVNDTLQQEADMQVRRFIDDVDVDVGGNGNDMFAGVARRTNVNTTTARHRRYPSSENEDGFT